MAAIIRPVCSGAWVAVPGRLKNGYHILDRGAPPSPNLRGHARLGVETTFTDGRSSDEWLQWLYDGSRTKTKTLGVNWLFYGALQIEDTTTSTPANLEVVR